MELLPRWLGWLSWLGWLGWLPRLSHGDDAAEEAPEERVPALV
ncbi:hypothetical protein [Microbispora sp. GKU 823]|nr:hypothetical protein [Microbispora sp. GKU 823]